MNYSKLVTGGCLSMFSAFSAIPMAYLTFRLEASSDPALIFFLAGLQLTGTSLFVIITLFLRKLLNTRFQYYDTDRPIGIMIISGLVAGFLVVSSIISPQLKESLSIPIIVVVILEGIAQIQFGYRLLKLNDRLNGLRSPFCYANMFTGVCIASIVLIPLGVIVSAVADLMLGTIFFQLARHTRENQIQQ